MCLPKPKLAGPSKEEIEQSEEAREAAEMAQREEIDRRAMQKKEDISDVLGKRGGRGAGRRSLFRASGTGFMGRFG
tara:strand:+ start:1628 stop:1855 length:228 start_codon:yes stop_codon:yes gene_type:complete